MTSYSKNPGTGYLEFSHPPTDSKIPVTVLMPLTNGYPTTLIDEQFNTIEALLNALNTLKENNNTQLESVDSVASQISGKLTTSGADVAQLIASLQTLLSSQNSLISTLSSRLNQVLTTQKSGEDNAISAALSQYNELQQHSSLLNQVIAKLDNLAQPEEEARRIDLSAIGTIASPVITTPVTTSWVPLLASNGDRGGMIIENRSTSTLQVAFADSVINDRFSFKLFPYDAIHDTTIYRGAAWLRWENADADGKALTTELVVADTSSLIEGSLTNPVVETPATTTWDQLLSANGNRKGLILTNNSTAVMEVAMASSVSGDLYSLNIQPGETLTETRPYQGAVFARWTTATGYALTTELINTSNEPSVGWITNTITDRPASTSWQEIAPVNINRKSITVFNNSLASLEVGLSVSEPAPDSYTFTLDPYDNWPDSFYSYRGSVWGKWSQASGNALITEFIDTPQ